MKTHHVAAYITAAVLVFASAVFALVLAGHAIYEAATTGGPSGPVLLVPLALGLVIGVVPALAPDSGRS